MPSQLYVNLPIKELERSVAFFTQLGFRFNPQFTDENATCMIISDEINVMMLVEPFFQTFTPKPLCNAAKNTEVLLAISVDSRNEVDVMVAKAKAAGAATPMQPRDYGFMYQHGFEDLDGHLWEVFYMDLEHVHNT